MNMQAYNRLCKKIGHEWAIKDEGDYMVKVCLYCNAKQVFFPEETYQEFEDE